MALSQTDFFDEEFFKQFPELAEQAKQSINTMFPVDTLSDRERQEMADLTARARRLSPLQAPAMQGSTRIPGNPHSTDISPVTNAVQSGLTNIINAVRQKRMIGDEEEPGVLPRLETLQQKQEQAQAGQESQREMLGRLFPELAKQVFDTERTGMLEEGRNTRAASEEEFKKTQNQLDRESREKIANIRAAATRSGRQGRDGLTSGEVVNLANTIKGSANQYRERANALQEFKQEWGEDANDQWGSDVDEAIRQAELKAAKFDLLAAQVPAREGKVDDWIKNYQELLGLEEDSSASGGVDLGDIDWDN